MTQNLKLSIRLQTVAQYITPNSRFADIGSDHAFLPCYICLHDNSSFAIAGEVQNGPLKRAAETVEKYKLHSQIDVRKGNGLEVIHKKDNIDSIIIAGMGGKLITEILNNDLEKLTYIKRLIIQPNTNVMNVRLFFLKHNFQLIHEVMVDENEQIYEILIAEKNGETIYQPAINIEKQLLFGPLFLQEKSPLFLKKWKRELEHTKEIVNQVLLAKKQNKEKIQSLQRKITWMEEILK